MSLSKQFVSAFYVYCNLVRYTYVGNIRAPVIGLLSALTEEKSTTNVHIYNPHVVHYYDLNSNFFYEIKISIKDQNQNDIEFVNGVTMIKMHLVKVLE